MSAALADLPLFAAPRPKPRPVPKPAIDPKPILGRAEQFDDFHRRNPQVYRELVRLAREAKARGANKLGMRCFWEVCRWQMSLRVNRDEDEPKLNNNFAPFYSRLIQDQEADLRGMFEVREREAGHV
jgi:hypothetical protein